jgi:hypothetical protein
MLLTGILDHKLVDLELPPSQQIVEWLRADRLRLDAIVRSSTAGPEILVQFNRVDAELWPAQLFVDDSAVCHAIERLRTSNASEGRRRTQGSLRATATSVFGPSPTSGTAAVGTPHGLTADRAKASMARCRRGRPLQRRSSQARPCLLKSMRRKVLRTMNPASI